MSPPRPSAAEGVSTLPSAQQVSAPSLCTAGVSTLPASLGTRGLSRGGADEGATVLLDCKVRARLISFTNYFSQIPVIPGCLFI